MMSTMSKEERTSLQSELAAALAAGKSCAEWASANGVSERTARRLASVGLCGRARGGQDARRRLLGATSRRDRHHEARLSDRHDRGRLVREVRPGPACLGRGRVDPIYHVRCAIDAGTSRHTAAVFFQVRHNNGVGPPRVTVFGDYHALDVVSRKNAFAIKELANQLPCRGMIDRVRLDPAAAARSSLGPAAFAEYEQVFRLAVLSRGGRATWFWTGSRPSTCCWKAATS